MSLSEEDPIKAMAYKLHHQMWVEDREKDPTYFDSIRLVTDDLRKRLDGLSDDQIMNVIALFVTTIEMIQQVDPVHGVEKIMRTFKDVAGDLIESEYQLLVLSWEIAEDD